MLFGGEIIAGSMARLGAWVRKFHRVDRSLQTDARAEPARPDGGAGERRFAAWVRTRRRVVRSLQTDARAEPARPDGGAGERRLSGIRGIRALVTGGTSGIGAAIVQRLGAEGAAVVFTGRDAQRGQAAAGRTGAEFVRADVRDPEAVKRSVREAVEILGGLEAVVVNAGVLHEAPLSETSDEAWDAVI